MNISIESERFPRLPRKPAVASRRSAIAAGLNEYDEEKTDACPPTLKTGELPRF